jgi:hypothetical protein
MLLECDEIVEAVDVDAVASLDNGLDDIAILCAILSSVKQRIFTMADGPLDGLLRIAVG